MANGVPRKELAKLVHKSKSAVYDRINVLLDINGCRTVGELLYKWSATRHDNDLLQKIFMSKLSSSRDEIAQVIKEIAKRG